jgi:hypothetical protein
MFALRLMEDLPVIDCPRGFWCPEHITGLDFELWGLKITPKRLKCPTIRVLLVMLWLAT